MNTQPNMRQVFMPLVASILVAVLLLLASGCGADSPTPTPMPTQPPVPPPPTQTPLAANVESAFPSGGLGLSREDWERQHGAPDQGSDVNGGDVSYGQKKYFVVFGDNVSNILRVAGTGNVLPLSLCQQEARAMLPSDARLVETHQEPAATGGADDTWEVYNSPSLIARFPADPKVGAFPWDDGGPGSIGIVYYGNGDGWMIGAGYANP